MVGAPLFQPQYVHMSLFARVLPFFLFLFYSGILGCALCNAFLPRQAVRDEGVAIAQSGMILGQDFFRLYHSSFSSGRLSLALNDVRYMDVIGLLVWSVTFWSHLCVRRR